MTTGFFLEHGHKEGWEETRRSGLGGEFKTNFACSTVHLMERKRGEKEEDRCEATHTGAESSRGKLHLHEKTSQKRKSHSGRLSQSLHKPAPTLVF